MSTDDTAAIIQVINLYGLALDAHAWELLDEVFTPDVHAEFGPAGAVWEGVAKVKFAFKDFHETLDNHMHTMMGHVVHVEGDPDHPINRGTLCPKGISLKTDIHHAGRLTKPKVREAGSSEWKELSWDDAFKRISRHMKDTRDRTFVAKNAKGEVVNRTPGIGWIGGCTDTNEFNWLQWKAISALGVPYRDTQARV